MLLALAPPPRHQHPRCFRSAGSNKKVELIIYAVETGLFALTQLCIFIKRMINCRFFVLELKRLICIRIDSSNFVLISMS